jgi:signal transduction histidine kinase/DNA-binding response OmpR family regulator
MAAADCLAGGGEMGALMRAIDWSQTPIGPVKNWPQSLRTAVGIMLCSRYAMFVWWGQQLTNLYNDAYRPFLGKKHPGSLGRSAREVWAEIWDLIGPRTEAVLARGEATFDEALLLVMERYGYPEETYFTFSYSPIRDDRGEIGGIFCAVTDETSRVIGERRLKLLREVAATASETHTPEQVCAAAAACISRNAHDLPFALLYLSEDNGRGARLAARVGTEPDDPAAAPLIDLEDAGAIWPLAEIKARGEPLVIGDLQSRFEHLPRGVWDRPPARAVAMPLSEQGQTGIAGFLVAGLNPYLLFEEGYSGFVGLLAGQIAAGIANARAYEEERKRAEALAEIDRAKTAFFSNVSHEFRTPLTLMLGPLEDALAAPPEALTQRRDDLALVHRNGLRLLRLVNTLLDFSRIEAGRVEASYEPVELPSYTAELASVFRAATDKAGLRLTIDCPPLGEPVWVDREVWEKIVLNLVSNAFKFTLAGGIAVRLRRAGDSAVLAVEDTGIGIPAYEIPRLFDRFHRVEGARGRTHEGTGIGLALVQELARLHGGTVRVESMPGAGSTFTVTIPLGTAHLPADRLRAERALASTALGARPFVEEALRWLPEAGGAMPEAGIEHELLPAQPPLAVAGAEGERARILVADDNADMRDYLRRLLSARYEVRTAADGAEALAALRDELPDLLLSDIMMPRLDGYALLRAVRADPALADLPVVLLSARAGEEASVEGLEAGADDYLVKPFSARELLARVAANLEMARLRRGFSQRTAADLQAMTRLHEVGNQCVRAGNELERCLQEILDAAIAITGADKGNIQLVDAASDALEIAAQRGFDEPFLKFFGSVHEEFASVCGTAMQSAGCVVVEDITRSAIFTGTPALGVVLEAGVRAVQSTPLLSRTGKVLGMISTHFRLPHRPGERELRLMDLLARMAADYLERRQAEAALRESEQRLTEALERELAERSRALEAEVAERQKIEAALHQSQRLEAIGRLTGGIAHDFNNLLTVVIGQTEAIAIAAQGNQRIARMAAAAQRAAERGAQLTSQLLSFSGYQQLQPAAIAVDRLILGIGDLVRRAVGEAVTVAISADPELWPAYADPAQFEAAILNLELNARDAMPDGGHLAIAMGNARITDRQAQQLALTPGDYVVTQVTDSGVGMPPEVQKRAFEPFFTTKDVGKGTGLGLAQIYGFAKQSGGTVTIDSAPGKGTQVALYLPRASAPAVEATAAADQATMPSGAGRTILVVEDQPDTREVVATSLRRLGYRILTASDGAGARLALAGDETIDLLLTDVVMPNGVSGIELAQEARRLRQDLKIVVVSGYLRETHDRRDALADFVFLEKPFRQSELAETIAAALAGTPDGS